MIEIIDMHLRDQRLLKWLEEHNNQRIPSHKICEVMNCHRNTVYAMVRRLEGAGKLRVIRSTRGGNVYEVKSSKCS